MFPSVRGRCVELGAGGTAPFFWQFVNGTHDTTDCLKRVVSLVPQRFRRVRPLVSGGTPSRLFYFLGHTNLIGTHYQNCRIPYSSQEHAWRKVNGSSNRGD